MAILRTLAVIPLTCIVVLAGSGVAQAGSGTFVDKHGDMANGLDLRRVAVANNQDWLVLRSKHRNLARGQSGGVAYYLDTDRSNSGPEFVVGGGTSGNSDWNIFRIHNWKGNSNGPIDCRTRFVVRYKRDTTQFHINKNCLKRQDGRIRVNVVAGFTNAQGSSSRDFGPSKRGFYPWVDRA